MIVTETVEISGREFIHNYSDEHYYIQKTGTEEVYNEAYDLPTSGYTYFETDKKIEEDEE